MAGNNYAIFPATTLEHETDHATRAVKDPIGFSKDLIRYSDPTCKYKEEKRVIIIGYLAYNCDHRIILRQ